MTSRPGAGVAESVDCFATDLLASMSCGLLTIDRHGRLRSLNRHAREILDLGEEARVGDRLSESLARHPHLSQLLLETLSLSTLPDRAETQIRTRDGGLRTIGFTLSRVLSGEGAIRGAALFFKDLTPIEREEERERLQDRLAALGSMAAALAHEIRNPLAALELSVTLLRRRLDASHPLASLARTIQDQIRRLSGTVNSSLEYVRPLELTRRHADLADVLDQAVEAAALGRTPDIRIVRRYATHGRTVPVDAGKLRQAFLNLVRNAVEAMAENGGDLILSAETPGGTGGGDDAFACVAVEDTGPGIPGPIRSKIFNPFFSTKPKGSGLGLAWTRKVVDAHGGVLDVQSQPGKGTVFSIRVPMTPVLPVQQPQSTHRRTPHEA
ncbi:MAG: nitrogen regulation protein NR(II) [Acidobacteriota bacterium]